MEDKSKIADWIKVIAEILRLIGEGLSEAKAINTIAEKYNLSITEVKKHFKNR